MDFANVCAYKSIFFDLMNETNWKFSAYLTDKIKYALLILIWKQWRRKKERKEKVQECRGAAGSKMSAVVSKITNEMMFFNNHTLLAAFIWKL